MSYDGYGKYCLTTYRTCLTLLLGRNCCKKPISLLGFTGGEALQTFANLGVTLLLFSIGLKLDLKSLARPEAWVGAWLHAMITVVVFSLGIFGLSTAGLSYFAKLTYSTSMLVAFALSFSSTVFAVKILEEEAEMGAMH